MPSPEVPLVAVVGAVGVPARYGGFETLAEQLARHVSARELRLLIYCQRSAYAEGERGCHFAGHGRRFLPLRANGPQSVLHDALAMLDAAVIRQADAMLVLGTSGALTLPLLRMLRPRMPIATNVDGLEWRRAKFGCITRWLLRLFEGVAVRASHAVVVDNEALLPFMPRAARARLHLIAYGGDHALVEGLSPDQELDLPHDYWLAIARVEPENNSAMILEAARLAGTALVYVGNWEASDYGRKLRGRFATTPELVLLDPIYDSRRLMLLRKSAVGYLHGHSVGGTNPSLVEALFTANRVLAFDCPFNRATLGGVGGWFRDARSLAELLRQPASGLIPEPDLARLRSTYRWQTIAGRYLGLITSLLGR